MSFSLKISTRVNPCIYNDFDKIEANPDTPTSKKPGVTEGDIKKQEDINGTVDSIKTQEALSKKLENLKDYGMDSFFNSLSPQQQMIFVKELINIGATPDNLKLNGPRCTSMDYIGRDGKRITANLETITGKKGIINFPGLTLCGKPGSLNVDQYFQKLSELNNFSVPLEKGEGQKIVDALKKVSAKDFLETGDEKLFNDVHTHFNKPDLINNGAVSDVLSKITELYGKHPDFSDLFEKGAMLSITAEKGSDGRKVFRVLDAKKPLRPAEFYFGP